MDQTKRTEVWKRYFGNATSGTDVFGRYVTINNFEVDHTFPQSRGGSDSYENLMPMSSLSNEEKSDDLRGTIHGKRFEVRYNGRIGRLFVNGICVSK